MNKVIPDTSEDRKTLLLATLMNPEALFWLGLVLFGTAVAGWLLIGVGVLLALIPILGLAAYWILNKRKGGKNKLP